jgi:phage shock protein C
MSKRLYRSNKDRKLGGVCGGIADYFDIDPVFVRILFVVAAFWGGSGILAYIICWIVIPEQPYAVPTAGATEGSSPGTAASPSPAPEPSSHKGTMAVGIILIAIGGLFLADNFLPHFHFMHFWPIILIALGIGLLMKSSNRP